MTLIQHEVSQEDAYGEGPSSSSKDCPSSSEQLSNSKKATKQKQNRRRQQVDIDKIISEFHEQQKESWEKFMQWEEKKMKVEAEEEKKRQQEYQQHEMQLFSMLARTLNNPPRLQPQEEFPQYSHSYDHQ